MSSGTRLVKGFHLKKIVFSMFSFGGHVLVLLGSPPNQDKMIINGHNPTSIPCEVAHWREIMHLPEDAGALNLDSWGIKRLYSHCLRRWLSGANRPRDA